MDFQNEYDSATEGINTIVTSQLSSSLQWSNIPGLLIKTSASSSGFVWAINNQNNIFVCQQPCTGNWTQIDTSTWNIQSIVDITTDSSNVYVIIRDKNSDTFMLSQPASNTGSWNIVAVPLQAMNVFSTNTYIWVQGSSRNKQKCAKPCTMPNWILSTDRDVEITSSSDTTLYGIDKLGNPVKTDENMQSPWSTISGLSGLKLKTIVGEADKTALYAIDNASKAYRCEGDCLTDKAIDPLDTGGYVPFDLTANPAGKELWMTATTVGDKGNVFQRLDTPDYSATMNNINPLEQNRDKIVSNIENDYKQQTNAMIANKQIQEVVDFFTKFFKFDKQSVDKDKSDLSAYRDKVVRDQAQIDQMTSLQPLVQKLLVVVGIVIAIYMFGSFLGGLIHIVALVILVVGVGYIIYSSG